MNRIPKNSDLSPLLGLEVIQIAVGQHEVILQLHPAGAIRLEGGWALKGEGGVIVDRSMEHAERDAWRIHRLIGKRISSCAVRDDRHLDVYFDGLVLEIEDDSDLYETFAIEHPVLRLYV